MKRGPFLLASENPSGLYMKNAVGGQWHQLCPGMHGSTQIMTRGKKGLQRVKQKGVISSDN
jgi:hypothetical protein